MLFEKYLKRPVRRPRTQGWESRLSPVEAAELLSLRTNVDALEVEYERSSLEITLTTLNEARIKLIRRTTSLHRRVADDLIKVSIISFINVLDASRS
jgi:hypothetical protein